MDVKSDPVTLPTRTTKAEQSEATRAALVAAGRSLFAERGYAAVATEEIVRAAGVTRGALYHHFDGKEELFAAVYEQVEADLVAELGQMATEAADPLDALHLGAVEGDRPQVRRRADRGGAQGGHGAGRDRTPARAPADQHPARRDGRGGDA